MCPITSREHLIPTHRRIDHVCPKKAKVRSPRLAKRGRLALVVTLVAIVCIVAGFLSRNWWRPKASRLLATLQHGLRDKEGNHSPALDNHSEARARPGQDHAGYNRAERSDAMSLQLSEQAQGNVGLRLLTIEPRAFDRAIKVPARVVERPGRTQIKVSALMTGIVTRIYPIRGEAVKPGQPLFDLRMTHEDLVRIQSEFLRTVEELDVIKREVARLEKVTASGAIAGKTLLERQYEQQKTEAVLRAQKQALILHGLTEKQVEDIVSRRKLLEEVTVLAPQPTEAHTNGATRSLLQVSKLTVEEGQHVTAGEQLCVLADHGELYIEGRAFEEDDEALNEAANRDTPITAIVQVNGKGAQSVPDLRVLYVEGEVDLESRALRFYVRLPNQLIRNEETTDGHRFIGWRYKPGQRAELRVPVERWENRIVLPIDAVVTDGPECFVFRQNHNDKDRFDCRPVHVEYRDQRWAVLANDAGVSPGDIVVASGAYQMHLALKNKTGGGVDPHAGHNH